MQLAGDIPFSIRLDDRGELKITATIHGPTGTMEAEVKNNEFQVNNPRWDRNWDHTGFEIVDEKQIPIFQVDRPRKNALRLRVYFAPLGGTEFSSRMTASLSTQVQIIPKQFRRRRCSCTRA